MSNDNKLYIIVIVIVVFLLGVEYYEQSNDVKVLRNKVNKLDKEINKSYSKEELSKKIKDIKDDYVKTIIYRRAAGHE